MSLEQGLDLCQWAAFVGVFLLLGSQIYLAVVWRAVSPDLGGWQLAGCLLTVVAGAASMVLNAYVMVDDPTLVDVLRLLRDTRSGYWISCRVCLAVGMWLVSRIPRQRPRWLLQVIVGLWLLDSLTAISHARTIGGWLPQTTDVMHGVGMVGWLGLLFFYAVRGGPDEDGKAVERLSQGCLACVVLLAATGAYAVWIHVPALHDMTDTDYGRTLLWKGGILTIALALAGYNRWRLLGSNVASLRRGVAFESLLVVVVLAITAVLTRTDPP